MAHPNSQPPNSQPPNSQQPNSQQPKAKKKSVKHPHVKAAPNHTVSVNVKTVPVDNTPHIELTYDPAGPSFAIDEQCNMPMITAKATFKNVPEDSKTPVQYDWAATLVFDPKTCPHGRGPVIQHPPISETTSTNTFKISFTQVVGGILTVTVKATRGTLTLSQVSKGLRVTGTNPSVEALRAEAPDVQAFRKTMRAESGLHQFIKNEKYPLYNVSANDGGCGICQITPPSVDDVWNWKNNLKSGWQVYQTKEAMALHYVKHVRKSVLPKLLRDYNDLRAKQKPPLPAVVHADIPDYTDEQLQRDTLRGYNGFALGLHEYRVLLDAAGIVVLNVDPKTLRGTASWELVTAALRTAAYDQHDAAAKAKNPKAKPMGRGSVNYVDGVLGREGF